MRLRLEHLDARGLDLELSRAPAPSGDQRVVVRSAAGLRGLVEHVEAGLKLSDVQADEVVLELLRLVFGSVVLTQTGGATLGRLRVAVDPGSEGTALDLQGNVRAERLAIDVGSVHVEGEAQIEGMCIRVRGDHGRIEAEHVTLSGFSVGVGTLKVVADRLVAQRLVIGWGDGFRLEAVELQGPDVTLEAGGTRLRATQVEVREVALHGARVKFAAATIGDAGIAVTVPPASSEADELERPASSEPSKASSLFDWRLLDGLRGDLGVDLAVDLTVPVIGRRRATHRFRVPIENGTIDYIRLENDLSTLENTLLDFAVRDGALVLERGIPLLPTRGRGKPIVVWPLSEEDLELAEQQRVRLAVLPGARLASESTPSEDEAQRERASSSSSVALRRLELQRIHATLGLVPADTAMGGVFETLRFETLGLQGDVHHDPTGEPRPGHIEGELTELAATLAGLPLGGSRLWLDGVRLAHASTIELSFEGLRPSGLRIELAGLTLGRTELREAEEA